MAAKVISIGEFLWDVFRDSEKLGGAAFNFSVHLSRLGHPVRFISAVGEDERGRRAREAARRVGLSDDLIQVTGEVPTGHVSVFVDAAGQPDFTIHRPAAYDAVKLGDGELDALARLDPEWLYFGTLHQFVPASREQTRRLMEALPRARRFYDINLRRNSYTPELVSELMTLAQVVKLNDEEVAKLESHFGTSLGSLEAFTRHWSEKLGWQAVAVTRGAHGCAIRLGHEYVEVPGYTVRVADTVGSGDAFAAAFVHGLSEGWDARRTGDFANRLGALIASRPGAVPDWSLEECWKLKAQP
jgi:fructokinase